MTANARYSPFDPDDDHFPILSEVVAYWKELSADRMAPAWHEFDLMRLPAQILPRVCVVDVVYGEETDFTYRFWGTAITQLHHYDLTGKSVYDLTPPDYAEAIARQNLAVLERRDVIGFINEFALPDGRIAYYASVRMPLSNSGGRIDQVLSAEDYGESKDQLADYFEKAWNAAIDTSAGL